MIIAALTGARLDAIICLKVGDCVGDAIRFKAQKKESGARLVPIHSRLAEVIKRRCADKAPEDDLFPEWPGPKKVGSRRERSFKMSNRFTDYRRKIGVDEVIPGNRRSRVNFHSFRRWFITAAERAGVPEATISSLVGHSRAGVTLGIYAEGPTLDAARAEIEKVRLPDLSDAPDPRTTCRLLGDARCRMNCRTTKREIVSTKPSSIGFSTSASCRSAQRLCR